MDIVEENNRSSTASIDGHCQPQWIVRDVYRWPLPATIDCASYPSIAIVGLSHMGESIDIYIVRDNGLWKAIDIIGDNNRLVITEIDRHCRVTNSVDRPCPGIDIHCPSRLNERKAGY